MFFWVSPVLLLGTAIQKVRGVNAKGCVRDTLYVRCAYVRLLCSKHTAVVRSIMFWTVELSALRLVV